jgi:hypothetical protein
MSCFRLATTVPGGVAAQAAFAFQAIVEIRTFEHGEQSFHGHRDSGVLNKPDVGVKHRRRIAIQTEDKSAQNLEALCLEDVNGMERILRVVFAHVLFLFGGEERGGSRGLNTHEDRSKPRLYHGLQDLVVFHEIHTGFGTQGEGIVACTLPGDQGTEQAQGIAPVADKVIIHEKYRAALPKIVQQSEFCEHLLRRFGPRHSPIQFGNITKLAIKRTPMRELQQHGAVRARGDEIIPGEGGLGDSRFLPWQIATRGRAALNVAEKTREGVFDLPQEEVIHVLDVFPIGGRVGSASHHQFARPLGPRNAADAVATMRVTFPSARRGRLSPGGM